MCQRYCARKPDGIIRLARQVIAKKNMVFLMDIGDTQLDSKFHSSKQGPDQVYKRKSRQQSARNSTKSSMRLLEEEGYLSKH